MAHPLDPISAKLDGAEAHIDRLEKLVREGAVTDLVSTRTDRDRKGRVRVRIKKVGEIPQQWHVWIGECVHDMRSALDHLAYVLNVAGSGKDPPANNRGSEFPIFDDRLAYRGKRGVRGAANMIKCFPRGARTRVERLQPYHRGNDPETRRLWELRELANIDKHRRFPTTVATNILMQHGDDVLGHRITDAKVPFRRLRPDTTIMWLTVPSLPTSVAEPDVNFGLGVEIEFDGRSEGAPIPLELPLNRFLSCWKRSSSSSERGWFRNSSPF